MSSGCCNGIAGLFIVRLALMTEILRRVLDKALFNRPGGGKSDGGLAGRGGKLLGNKDKPLPKGLSHWQAKV